MSPDPSACGEWDLDSLASFPASSPMRTQTREERRGGGNSAEEVGHNANDVLQSP